MRCGGACRCRRTVLEETGKDGLGERGGRGFGREEDVGGRGGSGWCDGISEPDTVLLLCIIRLWPGVCDSKLISKRRYRSVRTPM